MLTVHVRINDAATAKPTPVRLRIADDHGNHYPPLGRFTEIPVGKNEAVGAGLKSGKELWFAVDGSVEVPMPAGVALRIQATKGPEYTALDEAVTLGPGQMALRFTIARHTDLRAAGWFPGDGRCHFLSPHDALLEAAAEDLDVVNLLAVEQRFPSLDGTAYRTVPNLAAFSGQTPALEAHGRIVAVNTLNVHPVLGKVGLLYSHRPVFPLTFGGEEPDDWSLCNWCDQCHRKGGLTVWVDAFRESSGPPGGEALVAAMLGKIDAIEVDAQPRKQPIWPWIYRLWSAGFRIPLIGSSGKDNNRTPLGAMRTYAQLTALVQNQGGTGFQPVATSASQTTAATAGQPPLGGTGFQPVQSADPKSATPVAEQSRGGTGFQPVQKETMSRRHLPHIQHPGDTYHIIFRTRELQLTAEARSEVLAACRFWDGKKFTLHAAVVMPDHVHLLLTPRVWSQTEISATATSLSEILHSIKGYSAKQVNRVMQRSGPVWLEEWYNRYVRGESDFEEKYRYIADNPVKEGLADSPDNYPHLYLEGEMHGLEARATQRTPVPSTDDSVGQSTHGLEARATQSIAATSLGDHRGQSTHGLEARATRISELTLKPWIEAIRAGRSFITTGPLDLVSFEPVTGPGWKAFRYQGPAGFAHTSPEADGTPNRDPEAIVALAKCVRATQEWIETVGRFNQPKRKQNLLDRCAEALARLEAAP